MKKNYENKNIWKLINAFLKEQQITEKNNKGNKICIETSDNENMTTQNQQDSVKATLTGEFIVIQVYLKK